MLETEKNLCVANSVVLVNRNWLLFCQLSFYGFIIKNLFVLQSYSTVLKISMKPN